MPIINIFARKGHAVNRTDFILLLLSNREDPIVGTTRLQKLAFIGEYESKIDFKEQSFDFEPNKFGPLSKNLYDDIEFLVNIGYLEKTGETSEINDISLDDIEKIDANYLLGGSASKELNPDVNTGDEEGNVGDQNTASDDQIVYRISEKGVKYLADNKLTSSDEAKKIDKIKMKYGNLSLFELLKYVYTKYPKYATESEIKDNILL